MAEDVFELRVDFSPGYRNYCGEVKDTLVILLCGGDKKSKTQRSQDIEDAKSYWEEYKARTEGTDNE